MARFGNIFSSSAVQYSFVQANDAVSMQAKINGAFAAIAAIEPAVLVTAIDLEAAGDGPTFICVIEYAIVEAVSGGLFPQAGLTAQVYVAGDGEQSGVQASALPVLADDQVVTSLYAGGSKGTRFMAVRISQSADASPNLGRAAGLIAGAALTDPIGAGTTVLIGAAGAGIVIQTNVYFDSPADGILRYTGKIAGVFALHAIVNMSLAVALSAKLDIVDDPAGTPTPIGTGVTFTSVANLTIPVKTMTIRTLSENDALGLQISGVGGGGSGEVVSAQLLAVPV